MLSQDIRDKFYARDKETRLDFSNFTKIKVSTLANLEPKYQINLSRNSNEVQKKWLLCTKAEKYSYLAWVKHNNDIWSSRLRQSNRQVMFFYFIISFFFYFFLWFSHLALLMPKIRVMFLTCWFFRHTKVCLRHTLT